MKRIVFFLILNFFFFHLYSQNINQREGIVSAYDQDNIESLKEYIKGVESRREESILRYNTDGRFARTYVDEYGGFYKLIYIEDGYPIYYKTENLGSLVTSGVDHLNVGGDLGLNLEGENMIVGVWDGGPIRGSHDELIGRIVYKDNEVFLFSDEGTSHASHVSGTIAASGIDAQAKGHASLVSIWGNTFDSDESEVISQAGQGLLVSNHSYGIPAENAPVYYLGAYISQSAEWDMIHYDFPYYQAIISAGNDRGSTADTKGGRDLLVGNKNSKNPIVVAAVGQVTNYASASSVTMSSFSSWGPTDDFRIKPDISAKGVNVYSLDSDSNSDYGFKSGTSMAAPSVSGVAILLQEYFYNLYSNYMKASSLKGVLINTAKEAGLSSGPDYQFGWGLVDAEGAAELILNSTLDNAIIEENTLSNNQIYTKQITSDGSSPLRVTVVWTDPAGQINTGDVDDTTIRLVNDLDVRVSQNGVDYFPWVLNTVFLQAGAIKADNPYDNVECVDIDVPSGDYTITITHKGVLDSGSQDFSLIVSGVNQTLSLEDHESTNVSVYPNPFNDRLFVRLPIDFDFEKAMIFDVQGRLIEVKNNYWLMNESELVLDLGDLSSGVYLFKFISKNSKTLLVKRIVKQ